MLYEMARVPEKCDCLQQEQKPGESYQSTRYPCQSEIRPRREAPRSHEANGRLPTNVSASIFTTGK